jgi:hypothetical protein
MLGCDVVRSRVNLLPSDLRGWPLWPFLKGMLAGASNALRLCLRLLGAACGFWCELRDFATHGGSWKRAQSSHVRGIFG